jgi:predicted nuclease of predicted toxin-antitoxin system
LPQPPKETTERQKKARFLVDENLGDAVADLLREYRCNVQSAKEASLLHRDDKEVFAYARKTRRVLLTHDSDFLDNRRFPPRPHPGVGVLPGGDGKEEPLIRALVRVIWMTPFAPFWQDAKVSIDAEGVLTVTKHDDTGALRQTRFRFAQGIAEVWGAGK